MEKIKFDLENVMLDYIKKHPNNSSREIYEGLGKIVAVATMKRKIATLLDKNLIITIGRGKATKYVISSGFDVLFPIDVEIYFEKEIDEREVKVGFSFDLIKAVLNEIQLFTNEEMERLSNLQKNFTNNISKLTKAEYNLEFERLAIDLSWKSSQIEGNTYSLLETEKLLKEKETASGKTKDEAVMLLNHKATLDFILENPDYVNPLSVARIEDIHSLLVEGLGIDRNIRNRRVGISGTNYKPLDNAFQIKEALEAMCILINGRENIFEKGLLALVLLSYIQPFSDGNKRTARIISNAILINYTYCPLSFRTVDSIDYKKAMLVFYEQNNISIFKKIFMEQFEFAVKTYF